MALIIIGFISYILLTIFFIIESREIAPLISAISVSLLAIFAGVNDKFYPQTYIITEEPYLVEMDNAEYYLVKVRTGNREQILKLTTEQVENFKGEFVISSMEDFKNLYEEVVSEIKYN